MVRADFSPQIADAGSSRMIAVAKARLQAILNAISLSLSIKFDSYYV
jgi:hypothetical protein